MLLDLNSCRENNVTLRNVELKNVTSLRYGAPNTVTFEPWLQRLWCADCTHCSNHNTVPIRYAVFERKQYTPDMRMRSNVLGSRLERPCGCNTLGSSMKQTSRAYATFAGSHLGSKKVCHSFRTGELQVQLNREVLEAMHWLASSSI